MMYLHDPFRLDSETLVAAAPLLGHRLEDRSRIRKSQDRQLLKSWMNISSVPLSTSAQQNDFVIAPLDVLVSREASGPMFHIIELNGTGIGGISNMRAEAMLPVIDSLRQVVANLAQPEGVVLLAISGKESGSDPRLNKLMHEKMIFAEAMRSGLCDTLGDAHLVTIDGLQSGEQSYRPGVATVVMGYMKDLMNSCEVDAQGKVFLLGRQVNAAVNDRFCLNLISRHHDQIDLSQFRPINGTYLAGGDKGLAYSLLDEYLAHRPHPNFPSRVRHAHAFSRDELLDTVMDWQHAGRHAVIKPHGTGIGHGIEFFLDPDEFTVEIRDRIDRSIQLTQEYYGIQGGAFPYTICEYIDSDRIRVPGHRLDGHKYELRIVVFRDGLTLRACPTIAKVSSERFDAGTNDRNSLINNITHTSSSRAVDGSDFMLPLCNQETLDTLQVRREDITQLCMVATQYVRFAIDGIRSMDERIEAMRRFDKVKLPPVTRTDYRSARAA